MQLYYLLASNILKQLNCFPGGRSGLIEGPRSGCLGNAVAVWSSCPLRILLQFIAEAFFFFLKIEWTILFLNRALQTGRLGGSRNVILSHLNTDMAQFLVYHPGSRGLAINCAMSKQKRLMCFYKRGARPIVPVCISRSPCNLSEEVLIKSTHNEAGP